MSMIKGVPEDIDRRRQDAGRDRRRPTVRWTFPRGQFVVGIVFAVAFLAFGGWARYDLPYRDDWDWLQLLLSGSSTFAKLFTPHNEHVIPLPRLLFALQYAIGGAGGRLMWAAALLSLGAEAWMFWREIRMRWPSETSLFVFGAVAVLLFSTYQLQAIVFVGAVVFPIAQAAAVAAIVAALDASEQGWSPSPWLFLACLAAIFTATNGLVVPLIVAGVLWTRRAPMWIVLIFGAATLVSIGAHLAFVPRAPAALPVGGTGPASLVAFFLAFFAVALAYVSVPLATAVGALLFAGGLFAGSRVLLDREKSVRVEIFAVAVMAFAASSVAMIAVGRVQFGAVQAAQSRYSTLTLAYVAALVLWSSSYADRNGKSWQSPTIMRAVLALSFIALPIDLFIGTVWRVKAGNVSAAALSLKSGARDDEWIATVHPIEATVYGLADRLRQLHDAAIVDPLMGTALGELGKLPVCRARIQAVRLPGGGLRLTGTVEERAANGVVTDRVGIVRGLARPAPLVATPAPTERDVIMKTWRWLTVQDGHGLEWLGFSSNTGEWPYHFVAMSDERHPTCETVLVEPSFGVIYGPREPLSR